jgi:hypothetical protein
MAGRLPKDFMARFEALILGEQFNTAETELNALLAVQGDDPQLQILLGRLHYHRGDVASAEDIFRQVLRSSTQPSILAQARKALEAIEQDEINRRKQRSEAIATTESGQGMGFLALLPVEPTNVQLHSQTVTRLARILRIDPYSARFQLPTRQMKIIRVGAIANLQAYGEELQKAEIPCIWISLRSVADIQVQQVQYFQPLGLGEVRAVGEGGDRMFHWEQVTARVEGILPTYGNVFDLNEKNQIIRREQVLDRVRICDFHLPTQNLILRFHDSDYQFDQGMQVEVQRTLPHVLPTIHERWQAMMNWFSKHQAHVAIHQSFTQFADMLMLHPELVKEVVPRIKLLRPKPQQVDNCFELYSASIFLTASP